MTRRQKPSREALEAAIGHFFADKALLDTALTHVSALSGGHRLGSYQRLEFLGDRVLGLAVADLLYETFTGDEEGHLSRRLSELVRKETCAEIALEWDIGPHLKLGPGESQTGGRRRMTILGDACEAVIGAVYRDAGFPVAREVVRRGWGHRIAAPGGRRRDAKTDLQEWAQARGLKPPLYRIVARTGPDHAPVFIVVSEIETLEPARGEGPSRRRAEQEAAGAFLRREGVWTEDDHGERA